MAKPAIDKELCISCGNCIELCPDVFGWDEDEKAHVLDHDGCMKGCDCQKAVEDCPTNALTVRDDGEI